MSLVPNCQRAFGSGDVLGNMKDISAADLLVSIGAPFKLLAGLTTVQKYLGNPNLSKMALLSPILALKRDISCYVASCVRGPARVSVSDQNLSHTVAVCISASMLAFFQLATIQISLCIRTQALTSALPTFERLVMCQLLGSIA